MWPGKSVLLLTSDRLHSYMLHGCKIAVVMQIVSSVLHNFNSLRSIIDEVGYAVQRMGHPPGSPVKTNCILLDTGMKVRISIGIGISRER